MPGNTNTIQYSRTNGKDYLHLSGSAQITVEISHLDATINGIAANRLTPPDIHSQDVSITDIIVKSEDKKLKAYSDLIESNINALLKQYKIGNRNKDPDKLQNEIDKLTDHIIAISKLDGGASHIAGLLPLMTKLINRKSILAHQKTVMEDPKKSLEEKDNIKNYIDAAIRYDKDNILTLADGKTIHIPTAIKKLNIKRNLKRLVLKFFKVYIQAADALAKKIDELRLKDLIIGMCSVILCVDPETIEKRLEEMLASISRNKQQTKEIRKEVQKKKELEAERLNVERQNPNQIE
ncbi:hypothetical protein N9N03_01865 [Chlamydiia bacterium]|nr:hypothetical protein [Chlamydiia bacterium]